MGTSKGDRPAGGDSAGDAPGNRQRGLMTGEGSGHMRLVLVCVPAVCLCVCVSVCLCTCVLLPCVCQCVHLPCVSVGLRVHLPCVCVCTCSCPPMHQVCPVCTCVHLQHQCVCTDFLLRTPAAHWWLATLELGSHRTLTSRRRRQHFHPFVGKLVEARETKWVQSGHREVGPDHKTKCVCHPSPAPLLCRVLQM